MRPARPILLSPMAVCHGSMMAVSEALLCVRNTLLPLWLGMILFPYGWFPVVHSKQHDPPEVVIPLRITGTGIDMKPRDWLSYGMNFGGQKQVIHMKVNKHFLSRHFRVFTYTDQGALLEDQPFVQNDCYYHGYVEGDPESLVTLSTCLGGFQGTLQTNDTVYEIEPKRLSTTFEHLLYKLKSEETQFPPMRCGLTEEEIARQLKLLRNANFTLKQSGYEGWWTHTRLLELAVVVDHKRYLHHSSNTTAVQYEVCLVVNEVDNFFNALGIDVALIGIEVWTERNFIQMHEDIVDSLIEFSKWKSKSFNKRCPHDLVHLFVKHDFVKGAGLSYVLGICYPYFNCGIDSFLGETVHAFAYIVTHQIAHNFGINHDEETCKCGHEKCIMFPQETHTATRFSNCSYANFLNTMANRTCLYISSAESIFKLAYCGNSVVEEGEECDCGTLRLCSENPCCESNCTLRSGAACAFGLCCKDCQIVPKSTVCRKEENECDLPEWCNGTSYHCPEDVYVQNGIPCKGGGYCYEKRCNSREERCKEIFGKEAKSAKQSCYRKMNTQGDRFGNCGLKDARYVKCNISDILCGRIQCENVIDIPLLGDHSTVHWTYFNDITCWGTDYHFGMTIPDIGDVKDGTECGAEHICIQRQCVHMSLLPTACSPETCNSKGVCNNRQNCHCNYEWDPPFCLKDGSGGSIDSGPPPQRQKKRVQKKFTYLLLLWLIPFLLLLCLLIFYFLAWKRRNKSEEQNVKVLPNEEEQDVPISSKGEL